MNRKDAKDTKGAKKEKERKQIPLFSFPAFVFFALFAPLRFMYFPSPMGERFRLLAAVHLFLLRDDAVLMLRRFNTGYEDGNYSVIAGHLDGDEEVIAAAIREAREEADIVVAREDVTVVGVIHCRGDDEYVHFFVAASRWTGTIRNAEPEKCDALAWFPRDALPENVVPYVRRALDSYRPAGKRGRLRCVPNTQPPWDAFPLTD